MQFTGKLVDVALDFFSGKYRLTLEVNEQQSLAEGYDEIKDCEKLAVKITKYRQKRSLDANAFCWKLLHEMAGKLGKPAEDIYRDYIRSFGVCEIIPIRKDAVERWRREWQTKGYGWITENMGECRTLKGYYNIKCFYGSSSYTTQEMSQLIDAIVQDCKDLGIDTATYDEIERIKMLWQQNQ